MRRERVPKSVWCRVSKYSGAIVGCVNCCKIAAGNKQTEVVKYVLPYKPTPPSQTEAVPSPSTVESRLRDTVVKAAMKAFKEVFGWTDAAVKYWAGARGCAPAYRACARLELFRRATRKDAR